MENEHAIIFQDEDTKDSIKEIRDKKKRQSKLWGWFKQNLFEIVYKNIHKVDLYTIPGYTILYINFCHFYVWIGQTNHKDKSKSYYWKRREKNICRIKKFKKKGFFADQLGRLIHVALQSTEKYYLRLLLKNIPGFTCFDDMKTFDNKQYTRIYINLNFLIYSNTLNGLFINNIV